jgi:RNA polymerase sigma factor (TIGR02999 family)
MSHPQTSITDILQDWSNQDSAALARLMPLVFDELRHLARHYFSNERPDHMLQPTALVNEVYLRLSHGAPEAFRSRSQFFAFAARLMRQILVDEARARLTAKRGGGTIHVGLDAAFALPTRRGGLEPETLVAMDEALTRLGEIEARQRRVVEMRYFAGLTLPECATVLGISLATVERDWRFARRWLAREIARSGP